MGTGSGEGEQCRPSGSVFFPDVDGALNALTLAHPEYFDFLDMRGENGYRVRDQYQTAYHDGACAQLRARGLCCSIEGGYEEIAIKRQGEVGNAFGEGYDILSAPGYMLRSYQGTGAT